MTSGILQFLYLTVGILFFLSFSSSKKLAGRLSQVLTGGILLAHFWFLARRAIQAGHPPLTNMFETLHLLAFLTMFIFFILRLRFELDLVGGFAGLIAAVLVASTAIASPEIEPLLPALKSNWLLFHVSASFVSYSAFALAMGSALAYLAVDLFLFKNDNPERRARLLQALDATSHRLILFGYPLLTLGIATGSVWAELSWGRYWNWDPKETWAFATWIIYAVYFHLRYLSWVRGRFLAIVAVFAFGFILFTYYGVNFWLSTLHDYA